MSGARCALRGGILLIISEELRIGGPGCVWCHPPRDWKAEAKKIAAMIIECAHDNCSLCHGAGETANGMCVHAVACYCPKCSIRC